jgi:hypothetical protein
MPTNGCVKTLYCNKYHRLHDGVPLNHRCRILDPAFLKAESTNDLDGMLDFWESSPKIVLHPGEASADVAEDDSPPSFMHYGVETA